MALHLSIQRLTDIDLISILKVFVIKKETRNFLILLNSIILQKLEFATFYSQIANPQKMVADSFLYPSKGLRAVTTFVGMNCRKRFCNKWKEGSISESLFEVASTRLFTFGDSRAGIWTALGDFALIKRGIHFWIPPWGREQIWTAVQGFADLCLTTRPHDPFDALF